MATIVNSPRVSHRGPNLLIAADFEVWQRGTSGTLTGTSSQFFQADRWFLDTLNAAGTLTVSQQMHPLGQTGVPDSPKYFHRVTFPNTDPTDSGRVVLSQRIESVLTAAGRSVTVSFYAKCSSDTVNIGIDLEQNYGAGGSPAYVRPMGTIVGPVGTDWKQLSFTCELSPISGSLGSADYLQVNIWLFTNVTGDNSRLGGLIDWPQNISIDVSHVQVEIGMAATGFEPVHIADTLAKCQRYYLRLIDATMMNFLGYNTTGQSSSFVMFFPVTMRDTPTSTVFGSWNTGGNYSSFAFNAGFQGCYVSVVVTSTGTFVLQPTGGAGVEFDAEL